MTAQGSFTTANTGTQDKNVLDILPFGNLHDHFSKFEFSSTPTGALCISAHEIGHDGWVHGRVMDPAIFLNQTQDNAKFLSFIQFIDARKHIPVRLNHNELNAIRTMINRIIPGAYANHTNKPKPTL